MFKASDILADGKHGVLLKLENGEYTFIENAVPFSDEWIGYNTPLHRPQAFTAKDITSKETKHFANVYEFLKKNNIPYSTSAYSNVISRLNKVRKTTATYGYDEFKWDTPYPEEQYEL